MDLKLQMLPVYSFQPSGAILKCRKPRTSFQPVVRRHLPNALGPLRGRQIWVQALLISTHSPTHAANVCLRNMVFIPEQEYNWVSPWFINYNAHSEWNK
jgi:hypothetical protein